MKRECNLCSCFSFFFFVFVINKLIICTKFSLFFYRRINKVIITKTIKRKLPKVTELITFQQNGDDLTKNEK